MMFSIFKKNPDFNIMGSRQKFAMLSGALVVISLVSLSTLGLNFGVDFSGGYEIQAQFPEAVEVSRLNEVMNNAGLADVRVQTLGAPEEHEFLLLMRETGTIKETDKLAIKADFESLAGGVDKLLNWEIAESGETIKVGFPTATTESQVKEVLAKYPIEVRGVSRGERTDEPEFTIEVVSIATRVEKALRADLGLAANADIIRRVDFRGPTMGQQLRNQGIAAVLYALVFILLYIAVRFDLSFAPGAVVALAHDVIITIGVFSVFQIEFSLPIIGALLAIVGYSLNDTIVVYDRIRENQIRLKGRELVALVNSSINQTLSRTVLTSLTTALVIGALLVVGGGIIRDLSTALMVGVLIGTYSSVAIASPVYIALRKRAEVKEEMLKKAGGNPSTGPGAALRA